MENNKDHEGSLGTDRNPPSGTQQETEKKESVEDREEALKRRIEELRKRDPFIYK